MKVKLFRIGATLLALAISAGIVMALTLAGNQAKGPLENMMTYTSDVVQNVETTMIVDSREHKRSDDLQWLKPYIHSTALLKSPRKVLFGAYDNDTKESFENIVALEDSLHTTFPLIQIYAAWGSKTEEKFPVTQVKNIISLGSIPVVTWEPWLNDFNPEENALFPKPEEANKHGMSNIAKGLYDDYIKTWAAAAKKINKPIFIRFGHEMNDAYRYPWGPQNNTAADFVAAWHHVHDLFGQTGATNVVWIWGPHPAYGFFNDYYPGDKYVDYVGAGVLNYGSVAAWSKWWSFDDIFGRYYSQLSAFNKPIMITEFGSLAVGGSRREWYAKALENLPQRYPLIKSIVFYHNAEDNTTTQQTLNWTIKDEHTITKTIISEIKKWQ